MADLSQPLGPVGSFTAVDLRNVWPHEARDFTPWLAENLGVLSEALAMDLELSSQEEPVGPFSADLVCKSGEHWVLVENQVERTDHSHLGQIITYAAGLGAVTVVWIARRFTDEHRAALDWLNQISNESISFFGIELELWRIDESRPAPRLNVISKPNAWVKSGEQAKSKAESTSADFYLAYWAHFSTYTKGKHPTFGKIRRSNSNWVSWPAGAKNAHFSASVSKPEKTIRVRLSLLGQTAKTYFSALASEREAIQRQLPDLQWLERPNAVESYLQLSLPDADPANTEDWDRQHEWHLEHLIQLKGALDPYVRRLATISESVLN